MGSPKITLVQAKRILGKIRRKLVLTGLEFGANRYYPGRKFFLSSNQDG